MKLTKEAAERIRNLADAPEGHVYFEKIIEDNKSSSRISKISLLVSILALVVAVLSYIKA